MITQTVEMLEKELDEAKARIKELEEINEDLQFDITGKDREIKDLEEEKEDLEEEIKDYEDEDEPQSPFPSATMYDEMKRDYLLEIWEHYTPQEIEAALPRKQ